MFLLRDKRCTSTACRRCFSYTSQRYQVDTQTRKREKKKKKNGQTNIQNNKQGNKERRKKEIKNVFILKIHIK